jgi:alkanesulfonate monooxygenase SsuD/methylene tetrahydromethanopterin reductase-like flavin-dependent oxidoreductase (luciferase family)
MRIGLGPIALKDATRIQLESVGHEAVASSFDAMWLSESRAEGVGGGLAAAALLAQAVPIRIGVVIDAGLYHPLHLAEDIAIADLTSQGRIEVLLRFFSPEATSRYGASTAREWCDDFLNVLALALSGAHFQWNGKHLNVPARIEANQPAPERLALNPATAQPAVPTWIQAPDMWMADLAREQGFGLARNFIPGTPVPAANGRWTGMLLCPNDVQPAEALAAAGDIGAYFVVAAENLAQVTSAGRRLAGPLRMPDFPAWINQQQ